MIRMEDWTTIRNLGERGYSIKWIARELRVSRNTVRRALRSNKPPVYLRSPKMKTKVEPFRDYISDMLSKKLIGSRIFKELRKIGYEGSKSALYNYLSDIKFKDKVSEKVSERFETSLGEQGQFDWSHYRVMIGGKSNHILIFCFLLGYSRRKHYFFSYDETQPSCLEAMEDSFWHFGGVTKEVLVDNFKTLVTDATPTKFKWNPRFLEFCGYYKTKPVAHRVRRPRTKGKVEKSFQYLEEHFIKGNDFRDLDDFARRLQEFESEELDKMIHSTTLSKPIDRFYEEAPYLIPLPAQRFISTRPEGREGGVQVVFFISIKTNKQNGLSA